MAMRMLFTVTALLWVGVPTALAQSDPPPIWKGIYSAAQAERGKAVIAAHCITCHGDQRPLSGDPFMVHWEGHTVARLWRRISETMPVNRVTSVTDDEKLDALAFVLQLNGFPAGDADLTNEAAALAVLQILPREGPRPMRTGMAAEVVGCLTKGAGSWQVTNATEPVPSAMDLFESNLKAAAAAPLGTRTFQLLYPSTDAEPHAGKKVHVKGLLIIRPAGDRINVFSVEPLAPTCS
jgi:hypothetical protein